MSDCEPIIRPFGSSPAIRGTRLTVYSIMDNYFSGETSEAIAEFYHITLEEAQAATDYIDQHMAQLMPRYRKMLQREREGNPPEIERLFERSREKLIRIKAELERKRAGEARDARVAG